MIPIVTKIQARECRTKYASKPHLAFFLDGEPLDVWLSNQVANDGYLGLVPALTWLNDPEEKSVAWERIFPSVGGRSVAPILVCPDDQDYSCTVIVAEIVVDASYVHWQRLGLDQSKMNRAEDVGTNVAWFEGLGALSFDKEKYEICLKAFRSETE